MLPDSINLKKLIETGNFEALKHLLDKEKTAVHATNAEAQTLLHFACEFGQPEIAKYLLGKGKFTTYSFFSSNKINRNK